MNVRADSRPVVGIVGHGYVVPKFFGDLSVVGTPTAYADRVTAAGGRPVLLPGRQAVGLLDVVDALVLTGGGDLDPTLYGGPPATPGPPDGSLPDRERDLAEIALVRAAAAGGVPTLGVCRGMQVLVVAFGGTLVRDLGMEHVLPGGLHPIRTVPGSLVDDVVGDWGKVTSLHHQAVHLTGHCWRTTAWTEDGVAEAVEWVGPGDWPVLGVQWHPEHAHDPSGDALFGWLVADAGGRRRSVA